MPTYDYRCSECDHEFEKFQQMSAPLLKKCPKCGKMKLIRLIGSGAGVIFKGSGFYETDYRSDSYQQAAKSEKDTSTPKTDSKSDSKPKTDSTAKKTDSKKSKKKSK